MSEVGEDPAPGPKWLNDQEQAAWRGFVHMHAVVNRALRSQLQADTDLSLADYEILVALSEADEGELRSFQLAEQLQWEASRLSHQLRRMDGRGLVERRNCPEDRRGVTVVITAQGRAAIEAAAPLHVAEVRRAFIDKLNASQLDALVGVASAVTAESAPETAPDLPLHRAATMHGGFSQLRRHAIATPSAEVIDDLRDGR